MANQEQQGNRAHIQVPHWIQETISEIRRIREDLIYIPEKNSRYGKADFSPLKRAIEPLAYVLLFGVSIAQTAENLGRFSTTQELLAAMRDGEDSGYVSRIDMQRNLVVKAIGCVPLCTFRINDEGQVVYHTVGAGMQSYDPDTLDQTTLDPQMIQGEPWVQLSFQLPDQMLHISGFVRNAIEASQLKGPRFENARMGRDALAALRDDQFGFYQIEVSLFATSDVPNAEEPMISTSDRVRYGLASTVTGREMDFDTEYNQVAFIGFIERTNRWGQQYKDFEVYLYDFRYGLQQVSDTAGIDHFPRFAHSQDRVAYATQLRGNVSMVVVSGLDGHMQAVSPNFDAIYDLIWSSDDSSLLVSGKFEGQEGIFYYQPGSRDIVPIEVNEDNAYSLALLDQR